MKIKNGMIGKMDALKFIDYLYFDNRFNVPALQRMGIITPTESGYRWNLSKSCLTDYVKDITKSPRWSLLEIIFNYKKGTLKRLASTNGDIYKQETDYKSRDYLMIKNHIELVKG